MKTFKNFATGKLAAKAPGDWEDTEEERQLKDKRKKKKNGTTKEKPDDDRQTA